MDGTLDFYRDWYNYKLGFRDVNAEHWLGNDKLSLLLGDHCNSELRVDMESVDNEVASAKYTNFHIADSTENYKLTVSGYSSGSTIDPGDSLLIQSGAEFTTFDKDNDVWAQNCAENFKGAWWYTDCHSSNLNGQYLNGAHATYADGINWRTWKDYYESLKTTEMKFRAQL